MWALVIIILAGQTPAIDTKLRFRDEGACTIARGKIRAEFVSEKQAAPIIACVLASSP